ncbi:unnamed protein product, partial [Mesorhabditis belari]|uniref:RxLR effector protein n=1 Tax=Mesorhabditis belari TaxID=2138241 RepID=A0AAF3EIV9_9BILA
MKVAVVALICFFFLIDPLVSATEEKENAPMSVQNDVVDLFRRADAIVQPPDAPTLALEIRETDHIDEIAPTIANLYNAFKQERTTQKWFYWIYLHSTHRRYYRLFIVLKLIIEDFQSSSKIIRTCLQPQPSRPQSSGSTIIK